MVQPCKDKLSTESANVLLTFQIHFNAPITQLIKTAFVHVNILIGICIGEENGLMFAHMHSLSDLEKLGMCKESASICMCKERREERHENVEC